MLSSGVRGSGFRVLPPKIVGGLRIQGLGFWGFRVLGFRVFTCGEEVDGRFETESMQRAVSTGFEGLRV